MIQSCSNVHQSISVVSLQFAAFIAQVLHHDTQLLVRLMNVEQAGV